MHQTTLYILQGNDDLRLVYTSFRTCPYFSLISSISAQSLSKDISTSLCTNRCTMSWSRSSRFNSAYTTQSKETQYAVTCTVDPLCKRHSESTLSNEDTVCHPNDIELYTYLSQNYTPHTHLSIQDSYLHGSQWTLSIETFRCIQSDKLLHFRCRLSLHIIAKTYMSKVYSSCA